MKFVYRLALLTFGLLLAACGTVATPVWSEQAQGTQAALAVTAQHETEIAPTATATSVSTDAPTSAPTATAVPATATEAATDAPTATVEQPTAVPQAASGGEPNGNPEKGKEYFNTVRSEVNFACATCHHFDTEAQLIGPGLLNISTRAASRVPGESAYDYIHTSIVNPSAFVVPNFPDKLMPQVYKDIWTEEQINDIIAYLYTLKG
jgi:cytochrome c2